MNFTPDCYDSSIEQGTKRTRKSFALTPVTDDTGVRRWMEIVWYTEYRTYSLTKWGPQWMWVIQLIHPREYQPPADSHLTL